MTVTPALFSARSNMPAGMTQVSTAAAIMIPVMITRECGIVNLCCFPIGSPRYYDRTLGAKK